MGNNNRRDFVKKSTALALGASMNLTPKVVSAEPPSKEGVFRLGDFKLQSGKVLKDAFLSYETHGVLNANKDNVILYPTWFTGRHIDNRAAIGPGRALIQKNISSSFQTCSVTVYPVLLPIPFSPTTEHGSR